MVCFSLSGLYAYIAHVDWSALFTSEFLLVDLRLAGDAAGVATIFSTKLLSKNNLQYNNFLYPFSLGIPTTVGLPRIYVLFAKEKLYFGKLCEKSLFMKLCDICQ